MSNRRDYRGSPSALFDDGLEEGGLRASSSYSHEISEQDNDGAISNLEDRAVFLKRLSPIFGHVIYMRKWRVNRLLDKMGNKMDASRGVISGTMDQFKKDCYILKQRLRWNYENMLT